MGKFMQKKKSLFLKNSQLVTFKISCGVFFFLNDVITLNVYRLSIVVLVRSCRLLLNSFLPLHIPIGLH